jgi:hypothetical protein
VNVLRRPVETAAVSSRSETLIFSYLSDRFREKWPFIFSEIRGANKGQIEISGMPAFVSL